MSWVNKVEKLEAVRLRGGWYVRPAGALGSCGFSPVAWELYWVDKARNGNDAIRKVRRGKA